MLTNFKTQNPIGFIFLQAAVLTFIAFIPMKTSIPISPDYGPNIYIRTAYFFAAYLALYDVQKCAEITPKRTRNINNLHFWVYAFYVGYSWMVLMLLIFWKGVDNFASFFIIYGIGGVVLGIFAARYDKPSSETDINRYDLSKPITDKLSGPVYFFWPPILIILLCGFIASHPTNGWNENYLLFQLILLGSICPLYPHRKEHFWINSLPRFVGYTILTVVLFASKYPI